MLKKRQTFPSRLLHQFINLFVGFEKKNYWKKKSIKKDHVPHWWYTTVHIIRWPLVTEPLCDLKKIKESGVFSIILHQMIVNVKKKSAIICTDFIPKKRLSYHSLDFILIFCFLKLFVINFFDYFSTQEHFVLLSAKAPKY